MTRTIEGQKYWRPDVFHLVAAFVGMLLGIGGALIAMDARYANKEATDRAVTELKASDTELRHEFLESVRRIEDRLERATRRGVAGADVIPRGD